jgi:hypothetical protein
MAITTVKIWSENPGDPTAEGLEIGGIMISYAELVDIDSRETALDRGITPDLIELWDNQGGRDWSQLTDWLYQYAEELKQASAGTATKAATMTQTNDDRQDQINTAEKFGL